MKRILLASVASVFVIGSTLAQQATPMPGMDMKGMDMKMMMSSPNDPPSTKGYKSAMMKMMEAMPKFAGDADFIGQILDSPCSLFRNCMISFTAAPFLMRSP